MGFLGGTAWYQSLDSTRELYQLGRLPGSPGWHTGHAQAIALPLWYQVWYQLRA